MKQTNLKSKKGVLGIGLIAAIAIVVLVAIVFFGILDLGKFKKGQPSPSAVVEDQQVQDLQTLSSSDEIGDIEEDLENTNLENLDQDLSQVDQALEGL